MPTIDLPLTTYQIKAQKPSQKFGSPSWVRTRSGGSGKQMRVLARVPLDKVPEEATITQAILRFYPQRNPGGSRTLRVAPITDGWGSSVRWANQPSIGPIIQTVTATNPSSWAFDVTAWAQQGHGPDTRKGLRLDSTTDAATVLFGSAAGRNKPVLEVTYTIGPEQPGSLMPNGGSVSVAKPVLTYAGDDDMTAQKVEFSTDGISPSAATGWIPASTGRFEDAMEPGVQPALVDGGAGIWWRVTTDGAEGVSAPSAWAYYEYDSLPTVTILNPGATSPDGSPTLQWDVTGQEAFRASLYDGATRIDTSGWVNEPATRDWLPANGVPVPGGTGRFVLEVRDGVTPRVAATGALPYAQVEHTFTTTLDGAGTAVDSLTLSWDDPVPVLTGTRSAGVPDEVALVRDGVLQTLWTEDGDAYPDWAPGAEFFVGTDFTLRDYTSDPRHEHTWEVRTRTNGVVSAVGPTVTARLSTDSVWLVNPRTGDRVEVQGYNGEPAVEQSTEEQSILHVPINEGLETEPKRRRLLRTTRAGSVQGVVLNEHEDTLAAWVGADSGEKYRLIFGKVNWSVIIGDYSPSEVFYPDACGPDRVLVALNWWQRLRDV